MASVRSTTALSMVNFSPRRRPPKALARTDENPWTNQIDPNRVMPWQKRFLQQPSNHKTPQLANSAAQKDKYHTENLLRLDIHNGWLYPPMESKPGTTTCRSQGREKHTRLQTEITSGYLHFMSHNVTFQLSTSSDPKHMMFKSKPPSFEASMQTAMSLATSGNLASPIQGNHTAKVSVASTNWGLGLILFCTFQALIGGAKSLNQSTDMLTKEWHSHISWVFGMSWQHQQGTFEWPTTM